MHNVLLVGVGGQGTILASKILTLGLMEAGFDVKMSEIHGMSQRGGSVSSQIRYGAVVYSPVIELGGADILVAFEKMEALRWLEYLKPGGLAVVNDYRINPMPVIIGKAKYPEGLIDTIKSKVRTIVIDAEGEARKLGDAKAMNIVLLGVAVKIIGLADMGWGNIIKENVKPAFVGLNIKALEKGRELAESAIKNHEFR